MPRPRPYIIMNSMGWFVGAAYMPPVATARIFRYTGKIARASNARPYNRIGKLRQSHDSTAGWGHPALRGNKNISRGRGGAMPRPRPYIIMNSMGWFVGAAYMPPVAAARILRTIGQTARNGQDRSLQTCRKSHPQRKMCCRVGAVIDRPRNHPVNAT